MPPLCSRFVSSVGFIFPFFSSFSCECLQPSWNVCSVVVFSSLSCPIFSSSPPSPAFYFQVFSLCVSSCRHMLALSTESNNNKTSSSNLSVIDSTRSGFRETPCSIINGSSNHQTYSKRTPAADGQLFALRHPRTAALRWAAPRAASPQPRSFIRTWTAATAARPTTCPRTLRTRV